MAASPRGTILPEPGRKTLTTSDTGLPGRLPGFDDPIGLLRTCHEKMLAHCERLAALLDSESLDADAREAARGISRYFSQSAPLHQRDEEQDLFPRINRQSLKIAELVYTLKKEHDTLDALWARIAPVLKSLPDDGFNAGFRQTAAEFCMLCSRHIARENSELLPLASNSLSRQTLLEIGEAMAKRRGVKHSAL
jgi:hemerythrin-like domain-containing protein